MKLVGMLAGVDEIEVCASCGCLAAEHTPCCGSCSVCGNRVCPEFGRAPIVTGVDGGSDAAGSDDKKMMEDRDD